MIGVEWMARAACTPADTHLFYPSSELPREDRERAQRAARAICQQCPVMTECDAFAVSIGESWGVWGGKKRGRVRKQAAHPEAERGPRSDAAECGTHGGHAAHYRRKEPLCDAYREFHNAYQREQYHARKTRRAKPTTKRKTKNPKESTC